MVKDIIDTLDNTLQVICFIRRQLLNFFIAYANSIGIDLTQTEENE